MNQEKIGKFIASKRKEKKLTQAELAERLGVTDKSVSNWENGRNMPDLSLLNILCLTLDVSINDLLSGEEVNDKNFKDKSNENIINTIDYSNKKIEEKNNIISYLIFSLGLIFIIFGSIVFDSQTHSSFFSIIFGIVVTIIGVANLIRKLSFLKRTIVLIIYTLVFCLIILLFDYLSVKQNNRAPIFNYSVTAYGDVVHYNSLFYDVVTCDFYNDNKTYNIIKNGEYSRDYLYNYCERKEKVSLKKFITKAENTKKIIVAYSDFEMEGDNYVVDRFNNKYRIVKTLTSSEEINAVIDILNHAYYERYRNDIGYPYMFQFYDENDNLILEMQLNGVNDGVKEFNIYFSDKYTEIIKSYFED